jgi:hypothetical protein
LKAITSKRIGEALILSVYLVVDALDVWPKSHVLCLFLVVVGVTGLVLVDGILEQQLPLKRIGLTAAISATACFVVYGATLFVAEPPVVAPPAAPPVVIMTPVAPAPLVAAQPSIPGDTRIPLEDTEVYGSLKPANLPTPKNGCDGRIAADAIKIILGDNGIVREGFGSLVALGIKACHALVMERRPDGVFINASLYDPQGQRVLSIRDNKITALNGENYIARQSRDGSRLTIRNNRQAELFYVRFLNPTTVQARGFFGCEGGPIVHVQDGQPIPGFFMTNSCMANAAVGIQIGQP